MEKSVAEKAREILIKIRDTKEKIEKLNKMKDWDFKIITEHHTNGIYIPEHLQGTIFMLISASYENELRQLEKELEDL